LGHSSFLSRGHLVSNWRGVVRIEWYLFEADQGIVGRDGLRYSVEKGWYLSGYGGFFWSDGLTWK